MDHSAGLRRRAEIADVITQGKTRTEAAAMLEKLGQTSKTAYARYEQGNAMPSMEKFEELLRAVSPNGAVVIGTQAAPSKTRSKSKSSNEPRRRYSPSFDARTLSPSNRRGAEHTVLGTKLAEGHVSRAGLGVHSRNRMMKDTILWQSESDHYTERALSLHQGKLYGVAQDEIDAHKIASILPVSKRRIRSILDIGCGYGGLTAALARTFPHAKVVGVDPGKGSIATARRGLRSLKNVKFIVGHAHDIDLETPFDLVVLRMVLQWIPRAQLLKTIAEVDRLCSSFVFIQDFYPATPASSVSVHNKAVRIFKQDYAAILESVPYYTRIHETIEDAEYGDDYRRGKFLLKKLALSDSYQSRKAVQEKDKGRRPAKSRS